MRTFTCCLMSFVCSQNVVEIFFKQGRESISHRVHIRISIGFKYLGIGKDETDVLGELGRCCVMSALQSLTNSLQVHSLINN